MESFLVMIFCAVLYIATVPDAAPFINQRIAAGSKRRTTSAFGGGEESA